MLPSHSPGDSGYISRGTPVYRRVSIAFRAAGLVIFANLYAVQPLIPAFSSAFGRSPATASLALSASTFALALSLPVFASLSDWFGRKPVMLISLFSSSVLQFAVGLMPTFWTLVAARALEGFALAGLPAVAMTYLSEEMDSASLGFAMGLYISGNTLGGLLGRVLIGVAADHTSWRIGMMMFGGVSLILSAYVAWSLPTSRHFVPRRDGVSDILSRFGHAVKRPELDALYLVGGLLMGGFVSLYTYMGFRLARAPYHLSTSVIGLLFFAYLAGTFSSSFMGNLADRIGRHRVLPLNIAIMAAGAIVTCARDLAAIVLGMVIFTFGFFGAHSTASSSVGSLGGAQRAQASALYLFCYYVGSSVIGSLGGFFWTDMGWRGVIGMILAAQVLASAAFLFARRKLRAA
ncbi:MFS transporter [Alicyclobacillus mali (ex Roth et al. 2021)]|uniref:MFS transporter n=1 Tax=Alicyclobacillus mali (ex Roth et al. 2021) TaxID=1123961 RepID=UPI001A9014B7